MPDAVGIAVRRDADVERRPSPSAPAMLRQVARDRLRRVHAREHRVAKAVQLRHLRRAAVEQLASK